MQPLRNLIRLRKVMTDIKYRTKYLFYCYQETVEYVRLEAVYRLCNVDSR